MNTKITSENPYRYNRYGFAWERVPKAGAAHLDFGCYDGRFLETLKGKDIARLVGVDISREAVRKAHQQFPELEIIHISETIPLPFEDNLFTSVSILDVIEHVYEQRNLLDELNRVLKNNGTLIVTVPEQHIFSFLDIGNLKFRFPRVHRWYYSRKYSREKYESRYVSNPDGLIGDISAKKGWHEHFSRAKLEKLLNDSGFTIVDFDGAGFFSRIINNVNVLLGHPKLLQGFIKKMSALDAKMFKSTDLFCVARKNRSQMDIA